MQLSNCKTLLMVDPYLSNNMKNAYAIFQKNQIKDWKKEKGLKKKDILLARGRIKNSIGRKLGRGECPQEVHINFASCVLVYTYIFIGG